MENIILNENICKKAVASMLIDEFQLMIMIELKFKNSN